MRYIYNILLTILSVLLFPFAIIKYLYNQEQRGKYNERLGFFSSKFKEYINRDGSSKLIWIHAGSIGEVKIAKNIINQLRKEVENLKLVVSTGGTSGYQMAQKYWSNEQIFFLPLDLPWLIKRVVRFINPDLFILIETDLWPNLIHYLEKNNNKSILINTWLNQFESYKYLPGLLPNTLKKVDLIIAQTQEEKVKLKELSIAKEKIKVGGNLKFLEKKHNDITPEKKKRLLNKLNPEQKNVIVAGSTHKGEEKQIIELFSRLKKEENNILLIIAPRDIKRSDDIKDIVYEFNLNTVKKTNITNKTGEMDVIILDTIGELTSIYSIATISFVGGTLVDKGGHNLLEPAVYGKPVFFGPYLYNVQNLSVILQKYEVGFKVKTQDDFLKKAQNLINSPDRLKVIKNNSKKMYRDQTKALDYNLNLLKKEL